MKTIFFIGLMLLGTSAAFADESSDSVQWVDVSRFEATLSGGTALQTGYLTSQRSVGTYILGFHWKAPRGLLSVEWQGFRPNHDTGEFSLQNNSAVDVTSISLISHFKVYEIERWAFYLGLGFTDVFLAQVNPTYEVHYGTVVFAGMIQYALSGPWSLHYKTQWYNVEQTINDVKTSFEVWNHVVGVGYSF